MPDHVGYDSLSSARAQEVYEQFGKFGALARLGSWGMDVAI